MRKEIGILGFGNQAKAWARNLRDSDWNVRIFLRPGSASEEKVRQAGFHPEPLGKAIGEPEILAVLIPDDAMPTFYQSYGSHLRQGQSLIFAHGFSLHFRTVPWPAGLNWILLAPKGIASAVREKFVNGSGVPAVISVENDFTGTGWDVVESVANGLGCQRAGLYRGTAKDEVEADLFSEQALLCGGLPALVAETYRILVENGIQPEVAYLECVHELAFMVDLFQKKGISKTLRMASPTAQFGGLHAKQRLMTAGLRTELERIFSDIQRGEFTSALKKEASFGFQNTLKDIDDLERTTLEKVGDSVRNKIFDRSGDA